MSVHLNNILEREIMNIFLQLFYFLHVSASLSALVSLSTGHVGVMGSSCGNILFAEMRG